MHGLTDREILEVWEQGQELRCAEQAVVLLARALPEQSPSQLAGLSVGQRDTLLLQLRKEILGSTMAAVADCPRCGQPKRFVLDLDDVLAASPAANSAGPFELSSGGVRVRYRTLDSSDMAAAEETRNPTLARRELLRRCVLEAESKGGRIPWDDLSEEVIEALGEALEIRDPMALIPVDLSCDTCELRWLPLLDIANSLWRELSAHTERLLGTVQSLALTYGWSEADIFAMSPARRRFYLEQAPALPSDSAGEKSP